MIRAVVFDLGGVLIRYPCDQMFRYCADELGVPVEEFTQVYATLNTDFQKGLISEEAMWKQVSIQLRCRIPQSLSLWSAAFQDAYEENASVFDLALRLKTKGYRIGLLSNTEAPAMNVFRARMNHHSLFDVMVFSCAEGTCKPEERIFRVLLSRLDLKPAEVVFIDDNKEYVLGAQKLGCNAVFFTGYPEVEEALSRLL